MTTQPNSDIIPEKQKLSSDSHQALKQYRTLRVFLIMCFSGLMIIIGTLTAFGVYLSTRKEALSL